MRPSSSAVGCRVSGASARPSISNPVFSATSSAVTPGCSDNARIVWPARKLQGDNPDAIYHYARVNGSHTYRISVSGIVSLALVTPDTVRLEATETRGVPIRLRTAHGAAQPGSNKIQVALTAVDDRALHVTETAVFIVPR